MEKLNEEQLEALALEYVDNPPVLSGKPGYFTRRKEKELVSELLDVECARFVNTKAKVLMVSPSEIIQMAIKDQIANA